MKNNSMNFNSNFLYQPLADIKLDILFIGYFDLGYFDFVFLVKDILTKISNK